MCFFGFLIHKNIQKPVVNAKFYHYLNSVKIDVICMTIKQLFFHRSDLVLYRCIYCTDLIFSIFKLQQIDIVRLESDIYSYICQTSIENVVTNKWNVKETQFFYLICYGNIHSRPHIDNCFQFKLQKINKEMPNFQFLISIPQKNVSLSVKLAN